MAASERIMNPDVPWFFTHFHLQSQFRMSNTKEKSDFAKEYFQTLPSVCPI